MRLLGKKGPNKELLLTHDRKSSQASWQVYHYFANKSGEIIVKDFQYVRKETRLSFGFFSAVHSHSRSLHLCGIRRQSINTFCRACVPSMGLKICQIYFFANFSFELIDQVRKQSWKLHLNQRTYDKQNFSYFVQNWGSLQTVPHST